MRRRGTHPSDSTFWDAGIETMAPASLKNLQIHLLNATLRRAAHTPFYRERFSAAGLTPSVKSRADIQAFPCTTKDDLRQSYPMGMVAVARENLIRMHGSSGTTGRPTLIFYTKRDIAIWADTVARSLYMIGARRSDVLQNMMSYGLFTGGFGLHYGAERIGLLVLPMGTGNTDRQIQMLRDIQPTVIHVTPSYCLYLAHEMEERGISPTRDLAIRLAVLGAEPYSEATRRKLEGIFGYRAFSCYGLSEMNGPGVAFECPLQQGMHLWEDRWFAEIIDAETGEVLPDGHEGELVLTTLCREGMPIIRYRTRDLTRILPGQCPCGRTHRRIEQIKGRSDEMFIVKGINIFPSQIEAALMEIPEVDKNFLVIVDRVESMDRLTIQVEIRRDFFSGDVQHLRNLQERVRESVRSIILVQPVIELVAPGTIPVSTGKAKRVLDRRSI